MDGDKVAPPGEEATQPRLISSTYVAKRWQLQEVDWTRPARMEQWNQSRVGG